MIRIRRARDRGRFDYGWLDTSHTFSFGRYQDPRHMGFRTLRVLNEDWVQAGKGFPTHPHRDMEIVTWVLEGALQHEDSTGNGGVIRPGDVQRMSAGTGIRHSEYEASGRDPVHFLQIWVVPERRNLVPSYEQKRLPLAERPNGWRLLVSPDGAQGSVRFHQDARIWGAQLEADRELTYRPARGRHVWIQVARGAIRLNDTALEEGDGAAVHDEERLTIVARDGAEMLLFDLP
jgi:redox-sensitive bicupin YhaK (pirin superfamily)